jgi:hypothetical protein
MSQQHEKVAFPQVLEVNGRLYLWRSELEKHKTALVAHALGQKPPMPTERPVGDSLVPLRVIAAELGVTRRTLGRQIKDQRSVRAVAADHRYVKPVAAE